MKKITIILSIFLSSITGLLYAQDKNIPPVSTVITVDNSYEAVSQQQNGTIYQEEQTSCDTLNSEIATANQDEASANSEIRSYTAELTSRINSANAKLQQDSIKIDNDNAKMQAAGC